MLKEYVIDRDESERYIPIGLREDAVIELLKCSNHRMTRQRKILLDIILNEDCNGCKEIYYKANKADDNIGMATVYRMIRALEDIGAITRNGMYSLTSNQECNLKECVVRLKNKREIVLSEDELKSFAVRGMKDAGYVEGNELESIEFRY